MVEVTQEDRDAYERWLRLGGDMRAYALHRITAEARGREAGLREAAGIHPLASRTFLYHASGFASGWSECRQTFQTAILSLIKEPNDGN
jgi:hypothetical protein